MEGHPQLSGRLADFSSVPGYAYQPHKLTAYSLGVPRAMCQHAEEHSCPKSVHTISGSMFRFRGDESPPLARLRGDETSPLVRSRGDESPPLARTHGGHFVFPAPFRQGSSGQLKDFQRLLGLRAADSAVCHLGLSHMRPLQLWLESRVPWTAWTSGCLCIAVTRGGIEALTQPRSLQPGSSPVLGSVVRGGHDGCIDSRLGSSVRGNASFWTVVGI